MYEACPFGERRHDIRQAVSTTNAIMWTSAKSIEASEAQAIYDKLLNYLRCYADPENESEEVDHEALKKVKDANSCRASAT